MYRSVHIDTDEHTGTYTNAEIRQIYQDLLNAEGSDFFADWNVTDMMRITLPGGPRPDEACIQCYTPWYFGASEGWSPVLTTYWLDRIGGTWYITQEYYYSAD